MARAASGTNNQESARDGQGDKGKSNNIFSHDVLVFGFDESSLVKVTAKLNLDLINSMPKWISSII